MAACLGVPAAAVVVGTAIAAEVQFLELVSVGEPHWKTMDLAQSCQIGAPMIMSWSR